VVNWGILFSEGKGRVHAPPPPQTSRGEKDCDFKMGEEMGGAEKYTQNNASVGEWG